MGNEVAPAANFSLYPDAIAMPSFTDAEALLTGPLAGDLIRPHDPFMRNSTVDAVQHGVAGHLLRNAVRAG